MAIEIPFQDIASYTQQVTLDNVPYILEFSWNDRGNYWYIDISKTDQTSIITGIKLVLNYDILRQHVMPDLPTGQLYIIDTTGDFTKIKRDDFENGRLQIVYVSKDEIL